MNPPDAPERIWAWPNNYSVEGPEDNMVEWRWVPHYQPIAQLPSGQAWTVESGVDPLEYVRIDVHQDLKTRYDDVVNAVMSYHLSSNKTDAEKKLFDFTLKMIEGYTP